MQLMTVGFRGGAKVEVLESFYKNGKSIIGFLILVLIFNMIFDTEMTEKFVLLVLFSMIIINSEKFIDFFSNAFGESE